VPFRICSKSLEKSGWLGFTIGVWTKNIGEGMTGLTEIVAEFIVEKSLQDLPEQTVEKSKKVIADTFAVILSGAASEVLEPLEKYLLQSGDIGTTPVLGTHRKTSAEMSALINGTFGHALDFDDVLSMMPAHPSAIIVAALIADLEHQPLSGQDFIEAYAVGVEVGARIAQGITVGHYGRGFHGTGTLGTFSALGALCKAYKLDVETIRHAFGIAASMASGIRRNFGTMTKPLHTGLASRNALQAVRLAQAGFTAALDVLEAKAGFYAAFGVAASDPQVAIDAFARPGILVEPGIALKKFACCYACHRGMDGVLVLKAKHQFSAQDVVRLVCRMPPGGMQVLTYPHPVTGLEGKFSLQYCLAAGVLDGDYSISTFTDASVNRPEIQTLLPRVSAFEDESCRDLDDVLYETRSSGSRGWVDVEIELSNGTKDVIRVNKAPGHPTRELTWMDIEHKFNDCAVQAGLAAKPAAQAFQILRELERCADVRQLVGVLHH
jgi:2-methylcitrate dehydratase PrpD